MLEYLNQLDLASFNSFLYVWGAFSLLSAGMIHFGKQLPMSNRIGNEAMRKWGSIDKKTGWVLMEIPILLVVSYFFLAGSNPLNVSVVMFGAFFIHYFNRAIIYPQRIKVQGKTMPLMSMVSSLIFYIINGYLIGHFFGHLQSYPIEWLYDPRFIIGMSLFITGFVINIHSDNILMKLRKPGESGYKIPQGGLYKYVSCPNYMGECIEWIGFAIMTWSATGVIYAAWVVLPLFAQALGTHRWYQSHFDQTYPAERKAIIPGIV